MIAIWKVGIVCNRKKKHEFFQNNFFMDKFKAPLFKVHIVMEEANKPLASKTMIFLRATIENLQPHKWFKCMPINSIINQFPF